MSSPSVAPLTHLAVAANLLVQAALIGLVLAMMFLATDETYFAMFATWCAIGTAYVLTVGVVVGMIARREDWTARTLSRFHVGRTVRTMTILTTIGGFVLGASGALTVRAPVPDEGLHVLVDSLGVWAMLVSWALLHWGFAQSYFRRYHCSAHPTLEFPCERQPWLSDFVYFSVTVGTSFATSDTRVLSPAIRWTVTWHSVLSFLFNGAIVVVAFNTLTGN